MALGELNCEDVAGIDGEPGATNAPGTSEIGPTKSAADTDVKQRGKSSTVTKKVVLKSIILFSPIDWF